MASASASASAGAAPPPAVDTERERVMREKPRPGEARRVVFEIRGPADHDGKAARVLAIDPDGAVFRSDAQDQTVRVGHVAPDVVRTMTDLAVASAREGWAQGPSPRCQGCGMETIVARPAGDGAAVVIGHFGEVSNRRAGPEGERVTTWLLAVEKDTAPGK